MTILRSLYKNLSRALCTMLLSVSILFLIPFAFAAEPEKSILQQEANIDTITCLDLKRMMQQDLLIGQYLGKKVVCGSMTLADIPYYIKQLLEFGFNLVSSAAVVAIMWAGVTYMLSKDKEAADARKKLKAALIGFIVFLASFTIVRLLSFIFTVSS